MGPGIWTQVLGFTWQAIYPLKHLTIPNTSFKLLERYETPKIIFPSSDIQMQQLTFQKLLSTNSLTIVTLVSAVFWIQSWFAWVIALTCNTVSWSNRNHWSGITIVLYQRKTYTHGILPVFVREKFGRIF